MFGDPIKIGVLYGFIGQDEQGLIGNLRSPHGLGLLGLGL